MLLMLVLGCDAAGTAAKAPEAAAGSAPQTQGRPAEVGTARASVPKSGEVARAVSAHSSAPRGCRLMSASGEVTQGSEQPIAPGATLTGSQLLELGAAAKVHIKHVESGREWTVEGPARLVPCAGGEEEIFLGLGTLRTELGAGVRPGAQVLIGTPFGSVGYSDARAELVVTERELRLVASAGEAWLTPADPAALPVRVSGAKPLRRSERQRLAAAPALASCAKAAAAAESQAKALLLPSEQALGERASAHVRERQRARSLCAGAAAAALQQTRGAELAARLRELDAHRASWRRVPGSEG